MVGSKHDVLKFIAKGYLFKANIGRRGDCGNFALSLFKFLGNQVNIIGIFYNKDILPAHVILKYHDLLIDCSGIKKDNDFNREAMLSKWCFVDVDERFIKKNNCHLMSDEEFRECLDPRFVKIDHKELKDFIPISDERVGLLRELFRKLSMNENVNLEKYAFSFKNE